MPPCCRFVFVETQSELCPHAACMKEASKIQTPRLGQSSACRSEARDEGPPYTTGRSEANREPRVDYYLQLTVEASLTPLLARLDPSSGPAPVCI